MEQPEKIKPNKSIFKKILKIFLWFFAVLILLIGIGIALVFIYEKDVKAIIIKELNKNLKAEVVINPDDIDITIIKSFPDCSIEFKNVLMYEAAGIKAKDTLLFTKQLNLFFNVSDLWDKKYNIKKIKLNSFYANLKVFKNGKENFVFWDNSNSSSTPKSDSLSFNLQDIQLKDGKILYTDFKTKFKSNITLNQLDFSGKFKDVNYTLNTKGNLTINKISSNKKNILQNKNCSINLALDVKGNNYQLNIANINLNKMQFDVKGAFNFKDSLQNLNVEYKAKNLDIESILSLLPEKHREKINDYESSGNFYANGRINYANSEFSTTSSFGIKNAEITYKPKSITAKDVNLEGVLNYSPKNSELELKNISTNLNGDKLSGNFYLKNFKESFIKTSINANVKLENVIAFIPIDTITKLSGELILIANVEGLLSDLKTKTFSNDVNLKLNASVHNLQAQFKGDEKIINVQNCLITAIDREITVQDLKLTKGNSDVLVNGKMPGIFNYLFDATQPLTITGSLASNNLVLEDFIISNNSSSETATTTLIPSNVHFKLDASINKFKFKKFDAEKITGTIEIKNQKAIISDMHFNTMQGEAEVDAFADNSTNKLEVVLQANVKNINVNQLFTSVNNFGQSTLQDKNIKGFLTSSIDFSCNWNNKLEPDFNALNSNADITIERGELIDFKPLLSLSKFVDVQDLQRIKFSTLKSTIEIKNSAIIIPKTEINNSALNLSFWGKHKFNNEIDYHIQLLISELLSKKRKKQDEEFGPVENDKENRRSAFILMTGTVDDPIIKYDKKGLKEKIKNDIKEEKQTLKKLLKDEFGLFKKDSIKTNQQKKSDNKFELEKPKNNSSKKTLETPNKKEEDEDF
ncbi:MAG: AsmA-like C-terminal region-containing protein [Bacteroidota bacterium]|nr:AsmA-like C-terminal region-containing protein [Bacteroidota bacterium]